MIWGVNSSVEAIILQYRIKVLCLLQNKSFYKIRLLHLVKFHLLSKKLSHNLKNSLQRSKLYSVEMKTPLISTITMAKMRKIDPFHLYLVRLITPLLWLALVQLEVEALLLHRSKSNLMTQENWCKSCWNNPLKNSSYKQNLTPNNSGKHRQKKTNQQINRIHTEATTKKYYKDSPVKRYSITNNLLHQISIFSPILSLPLNSKPSKSFSLISRLSQISMKHLAS